MVGDLNLKKSRHVNAMSSQQKVWATKKAELDERKRLEQEKKQYEGMADLLDRRGNRWSDRKKARDEEWAREDEEIRRTLARLGAISYEDELPGGNTLDKEPMGLISNPNTNTSTITVDGKAIPLPEPSKNFQSQLKTPRHHKNMEKRILRHPPRTLPHVLYHWREVVVTLHR